MGADHTTAHVFDERVARDYEAWYDMSRVRPLCQPTGGGAALPAVAALPWREQPAMPVGCGTGHFTRWFAKQGLQVTGLDASPAIAMLEQASLRDGSNCILGDAQALPFEQRTSSSI